MKSIKSFFPVLVFELRGLSCVIDSRSDSSLAENYITGIR